jgi:hypothetical protein
MHLRSSSLALGSLAAVMFASSLASAQSQQETSVKTRALYDSSTLDLVWYEQVDECVVHVVSVTILEGNGKLKQDSFGDKGRATADQRVFLGANDYYNNCDRTQHSLSSFNSHAEVQKGRLSSFDADYNGVPGTGPADFSLSACGDFGKDRVVAVFNRAPNGTMTYVADLVDGVPGGTQLVPNGSVTPYKKVSECAQSIDYDISNSTASAHGVLESAKVGWNGRIGGYWLEGRGDDVEVDLEVTSSGAPSITRGVTKKQHATLWVDGIKVFRTELQQDPTWVTTSDTTVVSYPIEVTGSITVNGVNLLQSMTLVSATMESTSGGYRDFYTVAQ